MTKEELKLFKAMEKACKLGFEELQYQNFGRGRFRDAEYDPAFKMVTSPAWSNAHSALLKATNMLKKHEAILNIEPEEE